MNNQEAVHKIRRIVSKWLVDTAAESTITLGEIASVLIDTTEHHSRTAIKLNSLQSGQAEAWGAVFDALTDVKPGWNQSIAPRKVADLAVDAIYQLAAKKTMAHSSKEVGTDVRFDRSGRQEVIEQNGNDGLHYLPAGLTWEGAPQWANALVGVADGTRMDLLLWVECFAEGSSDIRAEIAAQTMDWPPFLGSSIALRQGHNWKLLAVRNSPPAIMNAQPD